jgi:hypothetical protein
MSQGGVREEPGIGAECFLRKVWNMKELGNMREAIKIYEGE